MIRDRSTASDSVTASSDERPDAGRQPNGVSRRRLLGATATTIATAGLAGCSGILGSGDGDGGNGSSDGDSGGSGLANVQNEVRGIEIAEAVSQSNEGRYTIMVTLRNTGGEDTSVLDFEYDVTLYDESGSEIETMGTGAANRNGFYDGNPGRVQVVPQIQASASDVARFELVVRCDEGPYCQ